MLFPTITFVAIYISIDSVIYYMGLIFDVEKIKW